MLFLRFSNPASIGRRKQIFKTSKLECRICHSSGCSSNCLYRKDSRFLTSRNDMILWKNRLANEFFTQLKNFNNKTNFKLCKKIVLCSRCNKNIFLVLQSNSFSVIASFQNNDSNDKDIFEITITKTNKKEFISFFQ